MNPGGVGMEPQSPMGSASEMGQWGGLGEGQHTVTWSCRKGTLSLPQCESSMKTKTLIENMLHTSCQAAMNFISTYEVLSWLLEISSDPGDTSALMEKE